MEEQILTEGGSKDTEEQMTTREELKVENHCCFSVAENDKSKQVSNHNKNADYEGAHMDDMTNNDETDVVFAGNVSNDELSVFNDSLDSSVKVKSGGNFYASSKSKPGEKFYQSEKTSGLCLTVCLHLMMNLNLGRNPEDHRKKSRRSHSTTIGCKKLSMLGHNPCTMVFLPPFSTIMLQLTLMKKRP
jgi:hypothetical protein